MLETFLDVLLIEEIPVENDTATGIVGANGAEIVRTQRAARKPQTGKVISCDTRFPWYGMMVDMPYKVGDVVRTNEFGRDYIVLNPEDEFKPDATKYYLIHYADIQGRVERSKDATMSVTGTTYTTYVRVPSNNDTMNVSSGPIDAA
jgi:co-chaperonin GroES (HSP10)